MVKSIVYSFSEAVKITGTNAFTIAVQSGQKGTLPTLSWSAIDPNADGSATQRAVTFSGAGVQNGSIANGIYNITVNAPDVLSDADSTVAAAASRTDTFYRLFAEVYGTRSVTAADFVALSNGFGESAGMSGYNAALNLDGVSVIDAADFVGLSNDFGIVYSGFTPTI